MVSVHLPPRARAAHESGHVPSPQKLNLERTPQVSSNLEEISARVLVFSGFLTRGGSCTHASASCHYNSGCPGPVRVAGVRGLGEGEGEGEDDSEVSLRT